MYKAMMDRMNECEKRMYHAKQLSKMGEKAYIFCRMYGCDPIQYLNLLLAKGVREDKARSDMFGKLRLIEEELRKRDREEAKKAYAEEHNDGFMDATEGEVPFDTG